jgi:hypothetical protein
VDWIGWDGYDRTQSADPVLGSAGQYTLFYQYWMNYFATNSEAPKPMMIDETGATTDQATYLPALATWVHANSNVKALLYYDSDSTSNWTLQPGNAGFNQFVTLANDPYFGYPYSGS